MATQTKVPPMLSAILKYGATIVASAILTVWADRVAIGYQQGVQDADARGVRADLIILQRHDEENQKFREQMATDLAVIKTQLAQISRTLQDQEAAAWHPAGSRR